MKGNTQNEKQLYYTFLSINPSETSLLNTEFAALTQGTDPVNIALALIALRAPAQNLRLYAEHPSLIKKIYPSDHPDLLVTLWFNPEYLEKNGYFDYYQVKRDALSEIDIRADAIQYSIPTQGFSGLITNICHCYSLYDLSKKIIELFNVRDFFTFIKSETPKNIPFLLSKKLEQLGQTLYVDEETNSKRFFNGGRTVNGETAKQAAPGYEHTLESTKNLIKLLAEPLGVFKKELLEYISHTPLKNKAQHIQYLDHLQQIELAIAYRITQFPEYLQLEEQQKIEYSQENLGFTFLTLPEKDSQEILLPPETPAKPPFIPNKDEVTEYIASGDIVEEHVNFKEYPISHEVPLTNTDRIVLGDMHGNAMKPIYAFIHENMMTGINEKEYQELVEIYYSSISRAIKEYKGDNFFEFIQIQKLKLLRFEQIISQLVPVNKDLLPNVISLGDTCFDRGENDGLTFKVFKQAGQKKILKHILLSNHDMELLYIYEHGEFETLSNLCWEDPFLLAIYADQGRSGMRLGELMRVGLISLEEVISFIEETYLPLLTGIMLNIDKEHKVIDFFSHAPVSLKIIPELADQLGVSYDKNTLFEFPERLDEIVNAINEQIKQLIQNKSLTKQYRTNDFMSTALYQLIWYRQDNWTYPREDNPLPPDWSIHYIHGHDGKGQTSKEMNNRVSTHDLDNSLGYMDFFEGPYTAYYYGNNPQFLTERAKAVERKKEISLAENANIFFPKPKPGSSQQGDECTIECSSS